MAPRPPSVVELAAYGLPAAAVTAIALWLAAGWPWWHATGVIVGAAAMIVGLAVAAPRMVTKDHARKGRGRRRPRARAT